LQRDIEFVLRCLVGFLDEAVQDDDAPTYLGTKKSPPDSFLSFCAYLEKSIAHCSRVGQAEICTVFHHAQCDASEAGVDSCRPSLHRLLHGIVKELYGVIHG